MSRPLCLVWPCTLQETVWLMQARSKPHASLRPPRQKGPALAPRRWRPAPLRAGAAAHPRRRAREGPRPRARLSVRLPAPPRAPMPPVQRGLRSALVPAALSPASCTARDAEASVRAGGTARAGRPPAACTGSGAATTCTGRPRRAARPIARNPAARRAACGRSH